MRGLSSCSQPALNIADYGCFMSNSNPGSKPTLKPGVALAIVSAGVTIAATLAVGFALAHASPTPVDPAVQEVPLPNEQATFGDTNVESTTQPLRRREHDDDDDDDDDDDHAQPNAPRVQGAARPQATAAARGTTRPRVRTRSS